MLYSALAFLIVGQIAGVLGLPGIASATSQIAWVLVLIGIVLLASRADQGKRSAGHPRSARPPEDPSNCQPLESD
jgi:uncharacterized membrane protein YtjA (UPF0391 family)